MGVSGPRYGHSSLLGTRGRGPGSLNTGYRGTIPIHMDPFLHPGHCHKAPSGTRHHPSPGPALTARPCQTGFLACSVGVYTVSGQGAAWCHERGRVPGRHRAGSARSTRTTRWRTSAYTGGAGCPYVINTVIRHPISLVPAEPERRPEQGIT